MRKAQTNVESNIPQLIDAQIAQICFLAKQQADIYIKKEEFSHLTHSEIYNSFKIIFMPYQVLLTSLKNLPL